MSSVDQYHPNSMSSTPAYDTSSSFTSLISSHEEKVIDPEGFSYSNESNSSTSTKEKIFASDGAKTGSVKWMSSKMRLMRKLRNTDQVNVTKMRSNMHIPQNQGDDGGSSNNNGTSSDNLIRVCSLCNTTKTPLWRGGPQGPKSLCNACGIRQRKARKAMAEAEASRRTQITISSNKINGSGDGRSNPVVPYKKRCKFFSSEDHEELQFEDLSMSLNRSSDVKEAAILLMALSSDIICG